MPTFKAQLSVASLDTLLKDIRTYQQKVEDAPRKMVKDLSNYGKQQIAQGISGIQDKDGNYLAKAESYMFEDTGIAFMSGEQAPFLEYGTGIEGASSPHPQANKGKSNWNYNSGSTIKKTGDWSYWDKVRGRWVHTKGIPAQMPVLRAAIAMRRKIKETAKEALK